MVIINVITLFKGSRIFSFRNIILICFYYSQTSDPKHDYSLRETNATANGRKKSKN